MRNARIPRASRRPAFRRSAPAFALATCMLATWLLASGCSPASSTSSEPTRPSKSTGAYGPGPAFHPPHLPTPTTFPTPSADWTNAPLAVLESVLSPALLIHSQSSYLALFRDLPARASTPPSHVAFSAMSGPKGFKRGDLLPVIGMEENWLVVWFGGQSGQTNNDIPCAVFLQHKPIGMILDDDGLRIQFRQPAGHVALMPLYGSRSLSPTRRTTRPDDAGKSKSAPIQTSDWGEFLPRDLLMRVRYWAAATRHYPIQVSDEFQLDAERDEIAIRHRLAWHAAPDDWNTKPLRLAPISPALASAIQLDGFPAILSHPIAQLDLPTPYGPYRAVENTDQVAATFPLLGFIHESEAWNRSVPAATNRAAAAVAAAARDDAASLEVFLPTDPPGRSNALANAFWLAHAWPALDSESRQSYGPILRQFLTRALAAPPASEAGLMAEALWAYAHHTGDWTTANAHWPQLKPWLRSHSAASWHDFGGETSTGMGSGPAAAAAWARLAYRAGDGGAYAYASSLSVRSLVSCTASKFQTVPKDIEMQRAAALQRPIRSLFWREPSEAAGLPLAAALAQWQAHRTAPLERLIPGAAPSPWMTGQDTDRLGSAFHLTVTLDESPLPSGQAVEWPMVRWQGGNDEESSEPVALGRIESEMDGNPAARRTTVLNWTTRVTTYELAR